MFLTFCPYSFTSNLYLSSFVVAPTFINVLLIFSVIKKWNVFNFFLDFRHFFGLQLVSFNIRQYWEFTRKVFSKISTYYHLLQFFPASVLFLDDFLPLNFILLLVFCIIILIFELV